MYETKEKAKDFIKFSESRISEYFFASEGAEVDTPDEIIELLSRLERIIETFPELSKDKYYKIIVNRKEHFAELYNLFSS